MKEERFLQMGSPSLTGTERKLKHLREECSTGVWRAKWSKTCTEVQCQPALRIMRHLSTWQLVHAVLGTGGSDFGSKTFGKELRLGYMKRACVGEV